MERGAQRLKGSEDTLGAGKREKEAKDKAQIPEQITDSKEQEEEQEEEKRGLDKGTPAQVALEKMQEKQMEQVLKKAPKTGKERVEFNGHLSTATSQSQLDSMNGLLVTALELGLVCIHVNLAVLLIVILSSVTSELL